MDHTPTAVNASRRERLPLPPCETASLECLFHRLQPIYDALLKRRFSDAAASRAVEVVLHVGRNSLASGKAAQMSAADRAGWLWRVAFNAAKRAAGTEPNLVALKGEPRDWSSESDDDQPVLDALRMAIDKLPSKQMQAIKLRGLQELSLREAARLMNVSPATVANRYDAGLIRLASTMKASIEADQCEKFLSLLGARAC